MKKIIIISTFILGTISMSCNDWLTVNSVTEMEQDDMFSSVEGFHAALIGIYLGMTDTELYGKSLTWYMLDYFAHYYALVNSSNEMYLHSHQYDHGNVRPLIKDVWNGLYNLIANCNNLLNKLDEYRNSIDEVNYQIMKGEALALRAYFHLDLMRMFGYGNLKNRDVSGKFAIPYVREFKKDVTPQLSYEATIELLKNDLLEAIDLLWGENGENCFRFSKDEDYFEVANGKDYRFFRYFSYQSCPRIDYYGARALLARVYMWEGKQENYSKILDIAQEWIDTEDDDGLDNWDWVSRSRVVTTVATSKDRTFTQEHIFHLHVSDLYTIMDGWLDASNPSGRYQCIYLNRDVANTIYDIDGAGVNDYRFAYLISPQGNELSNFVPTKLEQPVNGSYTKLIPLISTPEIYYMCAEIYTEQGNLPLAIEYLNAVRTARNLTEELPLTLNAVQVKEEILKEYRKEYVCLGQLFYYYKRTGAEKIAGYAGDMTDVEYVLPYPDEEIVSGNRVQ